jgi:glyoxylase-like metal-dependent hydrolase (beta-lactamase superfamily II)
MGPEPSRGRGEPLVSTRTVGRIRVHSLDAGTTWLDGGAMFGVVPKPLWERKVPPDERNRIPLALRCLLIEAPGALVLVDTGVGNKDDAKFRDIFGVDNAGGGESDPTRLETAIRAAGFDPGDVDTVLLTHLHFDHVGGGSVLQEDGSVVPAFPKARHVVQGGELRFAGWPNERVRASYLLRNIDPITEAGLWDPIEGETVVTEGVRAMPAPGHTPHHQCVLVEDEGHTLLYLGDLCPTSAHIPLPWIMGYDLEPLVTLESKTRLWERARREGWLLVFEHDADVPWGRLDPGEKRPTLLPSDEVSPQG